MNRGSRKPAKRPPCTMSGFNEAPIHESGKYGVSSWAARTWACFNEAPIHESGKYVAYRSGQTSGAALQ